MEGVDYATTRPNPTCLKDSGKHFAVRYVGTTSAKNLTPSEVAILRNAGIDLAAVYETTAGFMADGADGGIAAQRALSNASFCGMPAGRPIYFALDVNPVTLSAAQWRNVVTFLADAASVLGVGRVGIYGAFAAIERLVPHNAAYGWQTYAWSAGKVSGKACLYQYRNGINICGGTVDLCRNLANDFGQWSYVPPIAQPPRKNRMTTLHCIRNMTNGAVFRIGNGAPYHVPSGVEFQDLINAGIPVINYGEGAAAEKHLADAVEEWNDKKASVLYAAGTYGESVEISDNVVDIEELLSHTEPPAEPPL